MNELKLILKNLKQDYGIMGIRTDMASEVVSDEEFILFSRFCRDLNLKYTVKIGGCDALTDIYKAKNAGADYIISPMIETEYALQKFVSNCRQVYDDLGQLNLLINIETASAYRNIDSILECEDMKYIKGIVLGRDDMARSLSLDDVNSEDISDIALDITKKAHKYGKTFAIGGGVRPQCIDFLKRFDGFDYINCETRRVVFPTGIITSEILKKALQFEIKWLEYLNLNKLSDEKLNQNRINILQNCLH